MGPRPVYAGLRGELIKYEEVEYAARSQREIVQGEELSKMLGKIPAEKLPVPQVS